MQVSQRFRTATRSALVLTLVLVAGLIARSAVAPTEAEAAPPGNWVPVLNEEFNGGLNTALWTPTWTNGMSMDGICGDPAAVSQSGGYLNLRANGGTKGACSDEPGGPLKTGRLSGGIVQSKIVPGHPGFEFTYGYVEWKVTLPGVNKAGCPTGGCVANWPNFWSLHQEGVQGPEEIDIAEGLGGMCATLHIWNTFGSYQNPTWQGCDNSMGFGTVSHTFAVDWEPGALSFYYDDHNVPFTTLKEYIWNGNGFNAKDLPFSALAHQGFVPTKREFLSAYYLPPLANRTPSVPGAEAKVDYVKVWQQPKKPTVGAVSATDVRYGSVTLNGNVNPEGLNYDGLGLSRLAGNYQFECGLSGAGYTISSPTTPVGAPNASVPVSATISGLREHATYHCRMAASNAGGTTYTGDVTFTTPAQQSSSGYYHTDADAMNIFFAQTDGTLALRYAEGAGAWNPFTFPTTSVAGPVSVIRRANGDVQVFYRGKEPGGPNYWIYDTWLNHLDNQWRTVRALGAPSATAAGSPSATERSNGDMHIVYKGSDGKVHDLFFDDSAASWTDRIAANGGKPLGDPAISTRSDNGDVHAFYRDTEGRISLLWMAGGSDAWQESWLPSAKASGDPRALYRPDLDHSVSAFYRGTDGTIHDLWNDPAGWHDATIGGTPAGDIVPAYSTKTGAIHAFYRTATGYLRDTWISPQTNAWKDEAVGGAGLMTGSPSPVNRNKNGDLHVFYTRSNGTVWDAVSGGTSWTESSIASGARIDADSDDVFDQEDWCPTRSGIVENRGCPPERQQSSSGYYHTDADAVNIFFAQTNGTLALRYAEGAKPGVWNPFSFPTTSVAGPVSVIRRANGDVQVFYRGKEPSGPNYWIYDTWLNHLDNQWRTVVALGSPSTTAAGPPSATERNNGDMHIVYKGSDGKVHDLFFDDSSPSWTDRIAANGGKPLGNPAISTRSDNGDVHAFYRDTEGRISLLWMAGSSDVWQESSLPSAKASGDPRALYRPDLDHSVSVFYRGEDGTIHDLWNDPAGWHDVSIGGTPAGEIVPAYSTKTGAIHAFYRTPTGFLRDKWIGSGATSWNDEAVGGAGLMTGSPSPVNRTKTGDLHVFYTRSNGTVWDAVSGGTSWTESSIASGAAVPTG